MGEKKILLTFFFGKTYEKENSELQNFREFSVDKINFRGVFLRFTEKLDFFFEDIFRSLHNPIFGFEAVFTSSL